MEGRFDRAATLLDGVVGCKPRTKTVSGGIPVRGELVALRIDDPAVIVGHADHPVVTRFLERNGLRFVWALNLKF
jgi:hypothetical protein